MLLNEKVDNGFSHSMPYLVNGNEISMGANPLNSAIFNLPLSKTNVPDILLSVATCNETGGTSPIVFLQSKLQLCNSLLSGFTAIELGANNGIHD